MNTNITFLKEKDMEKLVFALGERVVENEDGNTPPFHPSCGTLQKLAMRKCGDLTCIGT
jgi:hypothetical protein